MSRFITVALLVFSLYAVTVGALIFTKNAELQKENSIQRDVETLGRRVFKLEMASSKAKHEDIAFEFCVKWLEQKGLWNHNLNSFFISSIHTDDSTCSDDKFMFICEYGVVDTRFKENLSEIVRQLGKSHNDSEECRNKREWESFFLWYASERD